MISASFFSCSIILIKKQQQPTNQSTHGHLPQAIAQVILAPPVCQSSVTGETIQWAVPQLGSAVSQSPAKNGTESRGPVLLSLNTQPPRPPLATQQILQYGVHHPVKDSTGEGFFFFISLLVQYYLHLHP